jgi:4-hydroxybenzoate polyprenyltransferase
VSNEIVATSPACEYDAPVLATPPNKPPLLRTLLILGRVSNLPTVWSNCLAGWLLAGGGTWSRFAVLSSGASLLYLGGMFLNDACDVRFDTAHRQERPIPSGAISARAVWRWSAALLLGGGVALASLGLTTALVTLGLVLCIVAYDLVHKQTALAPLLMAGCRFLLYLVAGSAALGGINAKLLWCAGALAAYIVGLSFIARRESERVCPQPQRMERAKGISNCQRPAASEAAAAGNSRGPGILRPNGWAMILLLMPVAIAVLVNDTATLVRVVPFCVVTWAWVGWSLYPLFANAIGRTVSALLAGIVLVDMLAVQGGDGMMPLAFLALFASASILQRTIPAT